MSREETAIQRVSRVRREDAERARRHRERNRDLRRPDGRAIDEAIAFAVVVVGRHREFTPAAILDVAIRQLVASGYNRDQAGSAMKKRFAWHRGNYDQPTHSAPIRTVTANDGVTGGRAV